MLHKRTLEFSICNILLHDHYSGVVRLDAALELDFCSVVRWRRRANSAPAAVETPTQKDWYLVALDRLLRIWRSGATAGEARQNSTAEPFTNFDTIVDFTASDDVAGCSLNHDGEEPLTVRTGDLNTDIALSLRFWHSWRPAGAQAPRRLTVSHSPPRAENTRRSRCWSTVAPSDFARRWSRVQPLRPRRR